jgi:hypothetical protein
MVYIINKNLMKLPTHEWNSEEICAYELCWISQAFWNISGSLKSHVINFEIVQSTKLIQNTK